MNNNSNNFRFGRLKANGARGHVQTETLAGEVHSNIRHPQSHGFESKPTPESETYSIYQGGNPDSGAVLIVAGKAPITLSEGDSVVYSAGGATVHCKDGKIELNGDAFGGLMKINDFTTLLNAFVTAFNGHSHVGAGLIDTVQPNFTASAYENEDVTHG
jgi:phage gp45-like